MSTLLRPLDLGGTPLSEAPVRSHEYVEIAIVLVFSMLSTTIHETSSRFAKPTGSTFKVRPGARGCRTDGVTAADLSHSFPRISAQKGVPSLMQGKLEGTAKALAARFGARTPFARARSDEFTLKFGDAPQHAEHQAVLRGRGIGRSVAHERKPACRSVTVASVRCR